MADRLKYERALIRQTLLHHRKREEQLERMLADLISHAERKCGCEVCAILRDLGQTLEGK